MKTIEVNVYKFAELSDKAKDKAISEFYDTNVNYDWWDSIYDDAATIGLKITGFDLDRSRHANGEFTLAANEVAQNIFDNHGKTCETFKTAETFMEEWQPIFNNYMDENHEDYESYESEQKMQDIEDEFLKSLCEDYSIMLQNEYEYLTSEKAIIESIEANDYDFTENGELF
jgi:hypothetical protein